MKKINKNTNQALFEIALQGDLEKLQVALDKLNQEQRNYFFGYIDGYVEGCNRTSSVYNNKK